MSDLPSTTAANGGRDTKGRFGAGNKAGKGNPHARKVAVLRSAILRAISSRDVRDVVLALLQQAKAGDVAATKELLQRLLGPPVEADLLARLEAMEARLDALNGEEKPW